MSEKMEHYPWVELMSHFPCHVRNYLLVGSVYLAFTLAAIVMAVLVVF